MLSNSIFEFEKQSQKPGDNSFLNLQIVVISVVTLNFLLTFLLPKVLISEAVAADSEFQSTSQPARYSTMREETGDTWRASSAPGTASQIRPSNTLENSQD